MGGANRAVQYPVTQSPAELSTTESPPTEYIIVGRIAGQYGVSGWVALTSYMRPPAQILQYRRWLTGGAFGDGDEAMWTPMQVAETHGRGDKLRVKLDGVDDREAAARLRGRPIAVAKSQLAKLTAGEYYWHELIGLTVINRAGETLGTVDHLLETGANDVLVVRAGGALNEQLLPWSPYVIDKVDVAGGRIAVNWESDE